MKNGVTTYNQLRNMVDDKFDFSQNGIIHKNVIDWLMENEL